MSNNKTFAFKLAQKSQVKSGSQSSQWKAREGVAVAGCTQYGHIPGNLRYKTASGSDYGVYC